MKSFGYFRDKITLEFSRAKNPGALPLELTCQALFSDTVGVRPGRHLLCQLKVK